MRQMRNYANSHGFTLIETMIVVAIIGILASIAYPSYQEHVQHANRVEARGILLEMAQLLERSYTESNSYSNVTLPVTQSPRTGTAKYTVQFAATPTQNSYTLEAVPTGFMASDACGTLTLTQTGARAAGGDVDKCWR
ncbi:hypothetical protein Nstercoris_02131 [Nitrosomonas stercoris]|uniref:Fimbrial protein n=1 Tax=Nitrosomonas stercoris TaxID=1444684 RepID=A0A4Y1YPC6_9PROT|nr:hypothetical protein Nstercoris_02131 [Nitrosomonas stercoris]